MTTDRQRIAGDLAQEIRDECHDAGQGYESSPYFDTDKAESLILRALEQSEGWVSVSELVKAAQRVSAFEHLTMETFDKTYPEIANLSLTEKADAVWQPLLTTLAAYKAALPCPPSAAEGAKQL